MGARPAGPEERRLFDRALRVARHAYAPYSRFAVGAVVAGASGVVYEGVNVENASYPVGQCAERVALGALVTAGERQLTTVAVAAADGIDLLPCGACLQALAELSAPTVVARFDGRVVALPLGDLLTAPFAHASGAAGRREPAAAGLPPACPSAAAPSPPDPGAAAAEAGREAGELQDTS
ncbi:MAG: cytidine deaminase [Actinobacteria bacterium]|nr:cytidine deaminase [Actinomycetota bacterium]